MVSVASLLNPEPPRAPLPTSRPAPVPPATRTVFFRDTPALARSSIETLTMADNPKAASRCKVKGTVNFPPYERLDEAALREVRRFHVYPFGSIHDTCRRIPYNSGKKDFFSKTGREFFEVFQYDFRIPSDDTTYTVMWDYSVGLVRMTPFFKCRGYSKTTPAKMLNQNPGLKDITYSITGGAIKAQGYWMPFACAKAVCATFCHKIAGALIPLFGPQFPLECISEKEPGYGRMIIDRNIIYQAKRDAEALFKTRILLPSPRSSRSLSPLPPQRSGRLPGPYDYHPEYRRELLLSPYGTDTDVDIHPRAETHGRCLYPAMPPLRTVGKPTSTTTPPTPVHSPGWTAVNQPSYLAAYAPRSSFPPGEELPPIHVVQSANPWLSAVPRSPTPAAKNNAQRYLYHHPTTTTLPSTRFFPKHQSHDSSRPEGPPHGTKRSFEQVEEAEEDRNYDAGESSRSSPPPAVTQEHTDDEEEEEGGVGDGARLPPPVPPPSPVVVSKAEEAAAETFPTAARSALPPSLSALAAKTHMHRDKLRPAAERDAAIMLVHMRGRAVDDEARGEGAVSHDRDHVLGRADQGRDRDGGWEERTSADIGHTGGRRNKGKRSDNWEGEDDGGGGGDDDDDDDAADVAASDESGAKANKSPRSSPQPTKEAIVVVDVRTRATPGPAPAPGGPTTRAKRRRTAAAVVGGGGGGQGDESG
ncbi:hypothetical protein VTK26DRAFT_6855 [Humicola hyalothermophila]